MNPRYFLPAVLALAACSTRPDPLEVKQFQLRDQHTSDTADPLVRMEKERHLRGAVSMSERAAKLGQYYTLLWNDADGVGAGEVRVVLEYLQGNSGSRVKRMERTFPASAASGRAEFGVVGEDYKKNGRVLAWKATVSRGGRVLASRQSYLWQ